ncbi:hypothetical protein IKQ_05901 [Bacillus cereus VDM053]|nr:hypothetical protein IKQ_05901 [Bacillus cereus VDM053]
MQNAISSYIHLLYSTVESSIRIFAREILGREFGNAIDDFKKIYTPLIESHCFKGKLQSYIEKQNRYKNLLNLFAMIRNTIHNNGVYFYHEDESIKWGKQVFTFEWGKAVHLTWDHLKVLTEGIIEAMDAIVRTKVISDPNYIKDPTPAVTTFDI